MRISLVYPAMTVLLLSALCCGGCGAPPKEEAAPLASLQAEWAALIASNTMNPPEAQRIALELAKQGDAAVAPLLETLADPKASPIAKVMVVAGMSPVIKKEQEPRLIALTGPDQDSTTRGCAAHLLGALYGRRQGTPDGAKRLSELLNDTDRHVRSTAILVLQLVGDPQGVAMALELWRDPQATPRDRGQVLQGISAESALANMSILVESFKDKTLEKDSRIRSLELADKLGDATVLEAVKAYKDQETDPELKALAEKTLETFQKRVDDGLIPILLDASGRPAAPPAPPQGAGAPAEAAAAPPQGEGAPAEAAAAPAASPPPAPGDAPAAPGITITPGAPAPAAQ